MREAQNGLETVIGFVNGVGTPFGDVESRETVTKLYAYAGRPDAPEVWVVADYGTNNKGLYIRIQDVKTAEKLYKEMRICIKLMKEALKENS